MVTKLDDVVRLLCYNVHLDIIIKSDYACDVVGYVMIVLVCMID